MKLADLLPTDVVDEAVLRRTVDRFRTQGIVLPTFAELAEPPADSIGLAHVDPDMADPRNLFRVNWYNAPNRIDRSDLPVHMVLPPELTGVPATIIVLIGRLFPLIRAHKVLAAYACLVPRVITGGFDPTSQRAVWPSTGNYARGGVAISTLMGCRGVAVLPEGMSRERFEWLDRWVTTPGDVIRTPGTESNVKEIYDACAELAKDPANVIFNQFSEYANHLAHLRVTGEAFARVYEAFAAGLGRRRQPRLRALVSATGSAGTIAAGDHLKEQTGSATVAVEALECPTMLYNGYGAHNIQGIGDKHIPLIHNVTNTDVVVGVSDRASDNLDVLFNTEAGQTWLMRRRGVDPAVVQRLGSFGLSAIANVVAAVKTAKLWNLGPDDVVMTVATDGAELYGSERAGHLSSHYPGGFGEPEAAGVWHEHLGGAGIEHTLELTSTDRNRIFNLGYFTWVEQQAIPLEHFESRRSQDFWRALRPAVQRWDDLIREFNQRVGASAA